MQRDMDLVRLLLLDIEKDARHDGRHQFNLKPSFQGYTPELTAYHFQMLVDDGMVKGDVRHGYALSCGGMTFKGHELLDVIRDPEIWKQTKSAAQKAGGLTLDLLKDFAAAYVKAKFKAATGLDL